MTPRKRKIRPAIPGLERMRWNAYWNPEGATGEDLRPRIPDSSFERARSAEGANGDVLVSLLVDLEALTIRVVDARLASDASDEPLPELRTGPLVHAAGSCRIALRLPRGSESGPLIRLMTPEKFDLSEASHTPAQKRGAA